MTSHDWYDITNVDDLASPTMLISPERVQSNLRRMIDAAGGVESLRPHVKTHKMTEVIRLKLAVGITKFKTSTIAETEMTLAAGGRDVLLAYQPVGPAIMRLIRLSQSYPSATLATLVDDLDHLQQMAVIARDHNVILPVYVDLNVGMNRTGIDVSGARELYQAIDRTSHVTAAGLHAYDGHLAGRDEAQLKNDVEQTFAPVWRLRDELDHAGFPVPAIVAAGTPTSQMLARYPQVEVGGGTSVLWDAGQPRSMPETSFESAAVLLTRVISRPTHDRLCLDLGHKAVASEFPLPRCLLFGLEDAQHVLHSEEHLVLQTDRAAEFPIGTPVFGVPLHICPTVALHQGLWCVRNRQATELWSVDARDRCLTV